MRSFSYLRLRASRLSMEFAKGWTGGKRHRKRPRLEVMEDRLLMTAVPMDFDGDGKSDFYVYDQATSTFLYSFASSPTVSHSLQIGNPADTNIATVADYDGDGKADFALYDLTLATYFVKNSANPGTTTVAIGDPTRNNSIIPVPADYNGDGKTDFAIFNQAGAIYNVKLSGNLASGYNVAIGDPSRTNSLVPVPADYNGDGKTDFAVFNRVGAIYTVKPSGNVGAGYDVAIGDPSHTNSIDPVPADYNGDGKTDFAIYDRVAATYYVKPSGNIAAGYSVTVGDKTHVNSIDTVPADYTGDGKVDFAIYDRTSATYFVKPSGNVSAGFSVPIGDPGHVNSIDPVPADYTGDGKADFAIYDQTAATYYVKPSGSIGAQFTSVVGYKAHLTMPIGGAKVDLNGDKINDPLIIYDKTTSTFIAPLVPFSFPGLPPRPNTLQLGDPSHDNVPIINANIDINGDSIPDPLIIYDRTTSTFIAPQLPSGVPGRPGRPNTLQLGDPSHDNVPIVNANIDINGSSTNDPLIIYDRTTSTFIAPVVPSGVAGQPPRPNTLQLGNPSHSNVPIVNSTANINGSSTNDPLIIYDATTSTFIAPIIPSGVLGKPPAPNTLQVGNPAHNNVAIGGANFDLNGDTLSDRLIVYDRTNATYIAPLIPSGITGQPPLPNAMRLGNPAHANQPITNSTANINGSATSDPLLIYDPNTSQFIAPLIPSGITGQPPPPNTLTLGDRTHKNTPVIDSGANINGDTIADPLIVYDPLASTFFAPAARSGIAGQPPPPHSLMIGAVSRGALQEIPGRKYYTTIV